MVAHAFDITDSSQNARQFTTLVERDLHLRYRNAILGDCPFEVVNRLLGSENGISDLTHLFFW